MIILQHSDSGVKCVGLNLNKLIYAHVCANDNGPQFDYAMNVITPS